MADNNCATCTSSVPKFGALVSVTTKGTLRSSEFCSYACLIAWAQKQGGYVRPAP